MTWFKVDDNLHSHPKRHQAGLRAMGLWVISGSWASAHLTDGFVPRHMLSSLGGQPKDARMLVESGLWTESKGGWQFYDWDQQNPTREEVEGQREEWRNRQRQARERKNQARVTGDTATSVTRDTPVTHPSVSDKGSRSPVPSRPDPSRPTPKGVGSASPKTPVVGEESNAATNVAAPKSKKGSRIPEGWQPSRTDGNANAEKGMSAERLRGELEKFRDYWTAKSGQSATKLDWDATWRNWLRNANDFAAASGKAAHGEMSAAERAWQTPKRDPRFFPEDYDS